MSYILDALKRADAERDRGAVPGLHTPPVHVGTAGGPEFRFRPLLLVLTGIGLLAVCAVLWRWQHPLVLSPTVASSTPVAVVTSIGPTVVVAVPAPAFTAAPRPVPQTSVATALPAAPRAASADVVSGSGAVRPTVPEKELQTSKSAPPPVAVTTGTPVMSVAQLPPDISQALPKLAISGSTWSENRAYRMVILNGQVFHEGDKPAADLTLEQITVKAVIFNFKGYRYSMPN